MNESEHLTLEDIERLFTTIDVVYHGMAYSVMRAAEANAVPMDEDTAHRLAASIIVQELVDHAIELIPYYQTRFNLRSKG